MLIRCGKKLKSVFLITTSQSGCGLFGWSFCSRQKLTILLLDLSVLSYRCQTDHKTDSLPSSYAKIRYIKNIQQPPFVHFENLPLTLKIPLYARATTIKTSMHSKKIAPHLLVTTLPTIQRQRLQSGAVLYPHQGQHPLALKYHQPHQNGRHKYL
jgi:hypothetical protein